MANNIPRKASLEQFDAINGGAKLVAIDLTDQEKSTFRTDLQRLAYLQTQERSLADLLLDDIDFYLEAAAIAKGSIGTNPTFAGTGAYGNEIGMQMIRAVTVENPGILPPSTPDLTWAATYGAAGWANVFGSASVPVDLSQTGLGSGATNTNNKVMLAITGLVNIVSPPLVQEYRWHIQQIDYAVEPFVWQQAVNLSYVRLANPVIIPVNGKFYMRGNIQPSGSDGTALFGLTFASADYLSYET